MLSAAVRPICGHHQRKPMVVFGHVIYSFCYRAVLDNILRLKRTFNAHMEIVQENVYATIDRVVSVHQPVASYVGEGKTFN